MREDKRCNQNGSDELDTPQGRIRVVQHRDVSVDVTALFVGCREATKSAQGVQNHAKRNKANEEHVQPKLLVTKNRCTARNLDHVPEGVLTKLNRACEGHMAEKEEAEDKASN